MHKKIKDLTLEEVNEICNKHIKNRCATCPFDGHCISVADDEYLEQEIEVENKPQKRKDLRGLC